jgi:hypothetical protein
MEFEQKQIVNRLLNEGKFSTIDCSTEDTNNSEFRLKVKQLLSSGEILVEFFKVNGDIRVMNCTTSTSHGAKYYSTESINEAESDARGGQRRHIKVNEDVCAVWDTKIGQWRSFRWSNLKKIDYIVKDK